MEARGHGRDRPPASTDAISEIGRISTGNVEADEVLDGGYPKQ